MKISRNRRQFQISFDSNNQVSSFDKEQEKDIIQKFVQPCAHFQFLPIHNQEIEKFKRKVIACANQYGTKNQKTTSIFESLLETTRELATNELKKKEYLNACSYYSMCLGFIDPDDESFLENFITTKIDIINKLMFCLFEMKPEKSESKYWDWSIAFVQEFLKNARNNAFQSNLLKSDTCMIELNYFYLGRVYRKKKRFKDAIEAFEEAQQIISEKNDLDVYEKNLSLKAFSKNLEIKIFYKISKCYREDNRDDPNDKQEIYEGRALDEAAKYNPSLYQYLNRKIRMYRSAKNFNSLLSKIEGKKKIQEEVLKKIEERSQKECISLYDVYEDLPGRDKKGDLDLKLDE